MSENIKGYIILGIKGIVFLTIILYIISPIDLMPEAILGPIGYLDDILLILFGGSFLFAPIGKATEVGKSAREARGRYQESRKKD